MVIFSILRPLYKIGPLSIPSYFLFLTLAFITGTWFVVQYFNKKKLNPVNSLDLSAIMIITGLFGARFLHALVEHPDYYFNNFFQHPFRLFMIWQGGFAYYGGFILRLPVSYWFIRKRKM